MPVFVNNREISDDDVHAEMINHPAPDVDTARLAAARALVVKQLLLEDAARRAMISAPEIDMMEDDQIETAITRLLDEVISVPEADDDTCARYYAQHESRFLDKTTDKILPYDLVKPHIIQYLEDKAFHAAFNAYLDALMANAKIVGLAA